MPWKSEAQRRFMWANHPDIAEEMEKHTTKKEREALPYHVAKKEDKLKKEAMFKDFLHEAAKEEYERSEPDLIFSLEDRFITKYAGMLLTDLSPEGVEQFIRHFMANELSFFPEKIDIKIEMYPLEGSYATPGGPVLENATGNIHLLYGGADVILPFMVRDREMLPFDVIQIGKERSVFTRSNLKKVLFGIQAQLRDNSMENRLSPYKGVDKHISQLTDQGFMHDVLKVQELATNYPVSTTTTENLASDLNDILEKLGTAVPIKLNASVFKFNLGEKRREHERNKIVVEKPQILKEASERMGLRKYINVHHLPTNSNIVMPEKDGSVIMPVKAKIYKEIISPKKLWFDRVLVISIDNRFADVKNHEKILAQTDDADWDFKKIGITGVKTGVLYTGIIGNGCLVPFTINKLTLGSKYGLKMGYIYECIDIDGNRFYIAQGGMSNNAVAYMNRDKVLGEALKQEEPDKLQFYEIAFSKKYPVMFLPETTSFIELRGVLSNTIKEPKEIWTLLPGEFKLGLSKLGMLKTAQADGEGVRVSLVSFSPPRLFDISVKWVNREHTPYTEATIPFKGVREGKARGVLKTLGLTFDETAQVINRAKMDGTAFLPMQSSWTPYLLKSEAGGMARTEGTLENLRRAFFNRENAINAGSTIIGSIAGTALTGTALSELASSLGTFADESKSLALKMEKIAQARKSPMAANLAKLMLLKNRLDTITKQAVEGSEFIIDVDLTPVQDSLSKIATDLIHTKVSQSLDKNEIISSNVLQALLNNVDGLYKYCQAFSNDR